MMSAAETARAAAEILDRSEGESATGITKLNFRRLIESTADGILVVDLAGTVLYANSAAAQIFGHPLEELLRVPLGRPVVSGETAEVTVHHPGRQPTEVEMRLVDVTWDGKPALLASLRDVSAKRAQEERQSQSQRLEAVGRLAAGIVHDFNNLIAVLESGLRVLEKQLARDPTDPKINMLIEEMYTRIENGGALTQQLLAFSRRQPLSPEPIDLNARIASLAGFLERTLGSGMKVQCALDTAIDRILLDANQFDVAVLNLAVNAKDAMAGNGTLTILTSNDPEDLGDLCHAPTSFVRVTMRDTGCGMSKDVLSQVFEPFFTTKNSGEGTGLGLSQVYGFVKQSGGHIRVESEVGKGTSVHLYLPRGHNSGPPSG